MNRRKLFAAGLACLTSMLATGAVCAQGFPERPVKIVVPFAAGGGVDILARALAAELASVWGQPVVVENVPGANSIVGAQRVAGAAKDGYTLLMTNPSTVVGNRFLYKELPYDPDKAFAPVSMLAKTAQFILANGSLPLNSLGDLIDAARRKPGAFAYSTPGKGSMEHLLMESMAKNEKIELLGVAYKGVAPAITAVVGNEVQITAASPGLSGALIQSGKLKPLAIAADARSSFFPDVPTTAEAGMPYAQSSIWFGLFAVAGTPEATLQKIHQDTSRVIGRKDFVEKHLTARGVELVASSPEVFRKQIQTDVDLMAGMVKATGLQPE